MNYVLTSEKDEEKYQKALLGDYKIIRTLSTREITGEQDRENRKIYLAEKIGDNSKYVIKEIHRGSSEEITETCAYEKLKKDTTITIGKHIDLKENNKLIYIISKYYNGGDLRKFRKDYYNNKAFEIEKISHIMKNIIYGLNELFSKNIVHRDIKLGNLVINFLSDENLEEKNLLKSIIIIIDFGSCLLEGGDPEEIKGTEPYMHPNLFKHNNKELKEHLDLWSLGVVCLKLFGGKITKEKENGNEKKVKFIRDKYYIPLNKNTKIELVRFIDCLLQENPEKQIKIDALMKDDFIINDPDSFSEFKEGYANKEKTEIIDNEPYIVLNTTNGLNFDYDKLIAKKEDHFNEYVNDCFLELNKNFLFTQPVLIPIIGIKEENIREEQENGNKK